MFTSMLCITYMIIHTNSLKMLYRNLYHPLNPLTTRNRIIHFENFLQRKLSNRYRTQIKHFQGIIAIKCFPVNVYTEIEKQRGKQAETSKYLKIRAQTLPYKYFEHSFSLLQSAPVHRYKTLPPTVQLLEHTSPLVNLPHIRPISFIKRVVKHGLRNVFISNIGETTKLSHWMWLKPSISIKSMF